MILVGSHIGHDAQVGSQFIFTNGAMSAGHTLIEDNVILGAMVGVHQFARVGRFAMIGAGAMLSKDAPPFALVQGDRARLVGINVVGLRRAGFESEQLANVKLAFRKLFWHGDTLSERLDNLAEMASADPNIKHLVDFVHDSKRGLVMPRSKQEAADDRSSRIG